jgi:hypothetical protein
VSDPVTLTVVLAPAHGGEPPAEGVTAATVAEHAPDAEAAGRVQAWFAGQGFEVGPLVGTAFAITAPAEHAQTVFGAVPAEGEVRRERLPTQIATHVRAIVAEPPPDFGPTAW